MLVMYLCYGGINVFHAFVCQGYRCWSCIWVLVVLMLVIYLSARGSMLVMHLCVRDIDVGHVFVCVGYRC